MSQELNPEATVSEQQIEAAIRDILFSNRQPSAWELVEQIESAFGWQSRWMIKDAAKALTKDSSLQNSCRQYLDALLERDELDQVLAGAESPRKDIQSGIDSLLRQSLAYRSSKAFQEMIDFMGRFKDYAPYNNMLVRIQNPSCSFYATEKDWFRRFKRRLKEDARPMLILAPMHPVLLVYDLDQTEGPDLPEELSKFASFAGEWKDEYLERTLGNAAKRDKIRIDFKRLSSTNAGFATIARGDRESKMRIAIHEELDAPSRYGVVCHELAHIYLGHLGTDEDYWWPSRTNLSHKTVEIEAEAVAFLVTSRLGLQGTSASYVSRYLSEGAIPESVSLDLIAKAAGRIEEMARRTFEARRSRWERAEQGRLL
ncbi:ImmA/IrrE family metallo-endopeptidase [Pseudacidobacterium ailaaui]|jgi:hypothetical protein|uniref:ImmA/IrrE family metallo-endopeptidase n=1 Tax=Pseudacidobacterium ailaaui TaxID=1382359 RepID=UPI00047CF764|nr:ImmA/IrrE family metallo-endopeptidase [Pseudacidobacterium ailaaui]